MADAIEQMLGKVLAEPAKMRAKARSEAERRFARDVVCAQISDALERLVDGGQAAPAAAAEPAVASQHG